MDSTIFKTAEPVKEAPVSPSNEILPSKPSVETHEPSEIPPSAYIELKSKPLVADLLQMGEAINHFQMKDLSREIDEFIQSEIKRQNLKDNQATYKEILQEYQKKTGLPEGTDVYTLTENILEHIRIDRKLIEAMIAKQELEKKPIEELTSKQLAQRIKDGTA